MPNGPPRRRRARPVADAPVDALLLRAEDLAKGWLLALLEHAPLHDAPAILAGNVSRDGPRICDAVVRALASDADLRRLEAGGALEPLAALAGSVAGTGGVAASGAVDALHAVTWSAVLGALPDPDAAQVAELTERLGFVIEHVRAAALRAAAGGAAAGGAAAGGAAAGDAAVQAPTGAAEPSPRVELRVAGEWPARVPPEPMEAPEPEEPDALWKSALRDEIRRASRSAAPLSLLIVELAEADRVLAVEGRAGAGVPLGRFARAVRSAVRRGDILACESENRAWIIATNTGRLGAQALADRVASAVRAAEPWRGAPLAVSAGIAVFREDGTEVPELIDAAEEARFAAEASGVAVVRDGVMSESAAEPEPDPAV